MIQRFRKKPVEVETLKWSGQNITDALQFCEGKATYELMSKGCALVIDTLEGKLVATPGDVIIKGVQGEFYFCKPDIFEQTYEPATFVLTPQSPTELRTLMTSLIDGRWIPREGIRRPCAHDKIIDYVQADGTIIEDRMAGEVSWMNEASTCYPVAWRFSSERRAVAGAQAPKDSQESKEALERPVHVDPAKPGSERTSKVTLVKGEIVKVESSTVHSNRYERAGSVDGIGRHWHIEGQCDPNDLYLDIKLGDGTVIKSVPSREINWASAGLSSCGSWRGLKVSGWSAELHPHRPDDWFYHNGNEVPRFVSSFIDYVTRDKTVRMKKNVDKAIGFGWSDTSTAGCDIMYWRYSGPRPHREPKVVNGITFSRNMPSVADQSMDLALLEETGQVHICVEPQFFRFTDEDNRYLGWTGGKRIIGWASSPKNDKSWKTIESLERPFDNSYVEVEYRDGATHQDHMCNFNWLSQPTKPHCEIMRWRYI